MNPGLLIVLLFLAFIATKGTVQYLLGTLFEKIEKLKPYSWLLAYASAGVGIALCWYYDMDALADLISACGYPTAHSTIGNILTGILVGQGASFVHDMWKKYFKLHT
jgi:hypothetical protein